MGTITKSAHPANSLASSTDFLQLGLTGINKVAQGACFLASGGGGSLQLALNKIIPAFFNQDTQITVVGMNALNWQGDWGCVVAGMGSPLKLFDDPSLVKAAIPAFQQLAELSFSFKAAGQERFSSLELMDFCLPVEVGAVNSIVPMIVSNGLSTPITPVVVIDADGAGRAVPTLPLTTYAKQLDLYPNILGGDNETEKGSYFDYAALSVQDESTLEAACLGLIKSQAFGFASGLAIYSANGPSFQACKPVANGISDAQKLGEIINTSENNERVEKVLTYINSEMQRVAKQIFHGTILEMQEATKGLDTGYVVIQGDGVFADKKLKLYIENENIWAELISSETSEAYIVGPDSMNYLSDTGDVFDNSDLWTLYKSGQRPSLSIIGIEAASSVKNNASLMNSWSKEVLSKGGPDTYIDNWKD